MSLYATNSTVVEPDATKVTRDGLTPGQIALITILTSFVFFLSMMIIVCVGELIQYRKGRKRKAKVRRKRRPSGGSHKPGTHLSRHGEPDKMTGANKMHNVKERNNSYTNMFENAQQNKPVVKKIVGLHSQHGDHEQVEAQIEDLDDYFTEVKLEFVDAPDTVFPDCDSGEVCDTGDHGAVPLISSHSDDIIDCHEVEILCDSSDSRDTYRLEADV